MMPDLAELLRLYGDDALDPQTLNWSEFQNAVFVRMFRKCQIKGELRNDEQGEVDFVLVESRDNPLTNKVVDEARHLFECKNYDRRLELAVAAKFLLVGLYRPNIASLNLVSRTELQPQAIEYATSFYQLDDEQPTHRKIGGMTIFRHFITRDLVGFDPVDFRRASPTSPRQKSSRRLAWELIELRPYSERIVSDPAQGRDEEALSTKYYYRFEATLRVDQRIKDGVLNLVETSGAIRLIEERTTADTSFRTFRHSAVFQINEPPSPEVRLQLALWRPEKPLSKFPVAAIRISDEGPAPADFRPDDAGRFEREFADTHSWRVILLTGEAGAGKTRLCNRFAQDQRARARWQVLRFDISENEDADLIRDIAVALMLPSRLRPEDVDSVRDVAAQVVDTLAGYRIAGGDASQRRDAMDPAQFTAQLAVGLGPRLIIIRNCERLNEAAAGKIEQLVHALERRGWGDVHVILEGREPGGGAEWAALRRRLHDTLDGIAAFPLESMTRDEVFDLLNRLFERISPELQEICWKRAGGNPLFLQNLLKWIQSSGGIESVAGRLRVTSPTLFRHELGISTSARRDSRITGGRGDAIILARLSELDLPRLEAPPPFDDPHFVLGLLALAETPARLDALTAMTGLAEAIRPLIECLRVNDLLDDSAKPGELRFRHDLVREAAIAHARDARYADAVDALARRLSLGFTVTDLISLELLADLRRFVGQPDAAWSHYERAAEAALQAEAFLDVCRIATKQERVYGSERPRGLRPFRDYLQMLMARAWAEWNCGSLRTARDSYHRVIGLAQKAPESDVDSTAARSIVGHARSRLVGIMLASSEPDQFVASAISALQEYSDIGDYNSVMNRVVLFCASYGLPELGKSFLDLATVHVAHREPEEGREPEGEAVICSDVAALYLTAMPRAALRILYEEVRLSRRPRQRLHGKIDVLAAEYLASRRFDLTHSDELRTEAAGLGLYGFVARLDLLEAAVELDEAHYDAARIKLERAEARIAIQTQSTNDVDLINNKLLHALATGANDEAQRLILQLIKSVGSALDGRERSIRALRERVVELAVARSRKLAERFAPSPLVLPVPQKSPALCGDIMLVWFNLRQLAASDDVALAALAKPIAARSPSELDIPAAEAEFALASSRCGIDYLGARLALCV